LRKLGHEVRLMPPSYVKAYVKRQKNDAADAEAICEAVTRPTMRFVEGKSPEQ
jgi:transposase